MSPTESGPDQGSARRRTSWSRATTDAVVIAIVALVIFTVATVYDAFDRLADFVEEHEDWQLDEIILALFVAGAAGFVYALRRYRERRREVVRREAAEDEVYRLAYTDPLTGLPNRRTYVARITSAIDAAAAGDRVVAVMILDLDHFKHINDVHGHAAGDAVLIAAAERLAELLPEEDIAARLGGDEFAIIARSIRSSDEAARLAAKIIATLGRPVSFGDIEIEVGVTLGIALFPQNGIDQSSLLRRADIALYRAKREGRGEYCFYESAMDQLIRHRTVVESALRIAIREDKIGVAFQPLYDLRREKVIGFEALARWTDSGLGSVPPTTFIEIAEDSGLITALSDQLLRKAANVAVTWPADVTLSFNLSPAQLRDRLLGLRMLEILAETGLPPHRLEIEITESAIAKDQDSARRILTGLHDAGIRIALDDFGTGYSSLAQLADFRFDRIKIDRSFVERVGDHEPATLVRAMIGLAKGLGIATTAEGVESAEQRAFLETEGCDVAQGFLLGKPMSAEEVARLLPAPPAEARRA